MEVFRALKHRLFLLLWGGQAISRLGDSLYQIGLAWWVLERTGSAEAMGFVLVCGAVPTSALALLGGVAVDRLPRAGLMLGADVLRGMLAFAVAALAASGRLEIWHLYLASLLFGVVSACFLPAYSALIPDITPLDMRSSANALTSLSAEIAGVAGPALGAYLVGRGGAALAFAADGASFVCSALSLLLLLDQPTRQPLARPNNILADLHAGVRAVIETAWLWMTIGLLALLNLTGRSPVSVGLPFLVRDTLRADVATLGTLYSCLALGSIAGALWAGHAAPARRGPFVYRALALVGLATLALGLPIGHAGTNVAICGLGMALAAANVTWSHIVQAYVPAHLFGRVASITLLGSSSLLPIGLALAGWAVARLGPAPVFLAGGALTAGLAGLGLASPAIRELE